MNLIGFSINKINAEVKEKVKDKVDIKTNINIPSISQEKIKLNNNEIPIKLDFEITIKYQPEVATLFFGGSVVISVEKKQSKKILEDWKNKKINPEIQTPLFNFIMTKTNLKALKIEEDLNLPPHIPLPKVSSKQNQDNTNYTG